MQSRCWWASTWTRCRGVGWSNAKRLGLLGLNTVADVRATTKERLQAELGVRSGELLWRYAHGQDDRVVEPPKPRKYEHATHHGMCPVFTAYTQGCHR